MIRSRNQNSILAVATLGVYLGLILAGATPSVLAQAATAKQFNVKDEVEVTENLDRKPASTDASSDETVNAKITSSVERLVSKVRASAASASPLLLFASEPASAFPQPDHDRSTYRSSARKTPISIVGTHNLARAGLA